MLAGFFGREQLAHGLNGQHQRHLGLWAKAQHSLAVRPDNTIRHQPYPGLPAASSGLYIRIEHITIALDALATSQLCKVSCIITQLLDERLPEQPNILPLATPEQNILHVPLPIFIDDSKKSVYAKHGSQSPPRRRGN